MFNLNLIDLPKLERIDGDLRYYATPTGEKYPSVTTVLKHTKDDSDDGLERWRKRVGEAEANKITNRSARRGTAVHDLCERYIFGEDLALHREMPLNVVMFRQLQNLLDKHVNNIRVCEGYLYSHKLKVAGAVDLVGDWNNEPAIIDFKTARGLKREEHITDYFLQTSMYSFMLWEMTGILHNKIAILIANEEESVPQVFETEAVKWLPQVKARCAAFHKNLLHNDG